jgi:hypothetical protein
MRTKLLVLVGVAAVALSSCAGSSDVPTNVGQTTFTANAHVSCDGGNQTAGNEPCGFYFAWRRHGTSDAWAGGPVHDNINSVVNNQAIHEDETGLSPGTTYDTQICGKGDTVHSWSCENGVQTFTTQSSGSSNDTPVPGPPSGWTRVGADGFAGQSGSFPASFTQYPAGWKDTSKQGTYGCGGGTIVSGGDFGFNLVGSQVCAPVFKDQGGAGTDGFGIPHGMTEGRYSVRFRVQSGSQYHKIAWLLWPDGDQGAGELDFPEVAPNFPGDASAFTHKTDGTRDDFKSGVTLPDAGWHVATIERKSSSVRYLLDGNVVGTSTSNLPQQAMHWVLQSETKVESTSPPPSSATTNIAIDWVTVDKPGTTPPPPPKQCADGKDNDGDGKIDLADPGCSGSTDDDETDPVTGGTITAAAVGDVCGDTSCGQGTATANTIRAINPSVILGLGDYQYQSDGSGGSTFQAGFQSKWSGLTGLIDPVFGNTHDTESGSGVPSGYILDFFDANGGAGARGKVKAGYTTGSKWGYSFDFPTIGWHIVALNYTAGSGAIAGLKADLDAHPSKCLMVLDHAPIYGSPTSTHSSNEGAFFAPTLQAAGADLYLTGHQHMYERVNVPDGSTSITNGEGGVGHYARTSTASGSVAYNSASYGPIKLTLTSTGWSSAFVPNQGASSFSDSASGGC